MPEAAAVWRHSGTLAQATLCDNAAIADPDNTYDVELQDSLYALIGGCDFLAPQLDARGYTAAATSLRTAAGEARHVLHAIEHGPEPGA